MANVDLVNGTGSSIVAGGETVPAHSVLSNRTVTGANLILLTDAGAVAYLAGMAYEQKRLSSKIMKLGRNPGTATVSM